MITIIVDTDNEYILMKAAAERYICGQTRFGDCLKYEPGHCWECYNDNHIKCGIRIITPVDSTKPDNL